MNLSAPFVRRPIATTLLALAILLAGLAAFRVLPVAPLPRVDFPTISVSANMPGASPETMASSIATPLERRFGRIAGVTEITSTSTLGQTQITMQFDLDRDVDDAARDVQAAINAAGGELPINMPMRPTFRKVNPADAPTMILSLTSKTMILGEVFEAANTVLAQKIAQVSGVGQVFVGGGQQPAVRVQADPAKLAAMGMSMADLRNALATATTDQPKGAIAGPETSSAVAANDQLHGAAAFQDVVVRYAQGSAVRLRDVATVFDDVENNRVAAWSNGDRAVLVIIRRQPGANILETNQRIRELLPQLMQSISPSIHVDIAMDRTQTIRASVQEVEISLGLSILLVVLVVFVFLRSVRATAIPSVAVPLSLVGTFGGMYLLGYSLDNLSLMALTISTGFVVDDAIVVTENVSRHLDEGLSPREAALLGAKEIGFTIVSITASLLAVFIPILLMGGIVGRLFREFAVTLSMAIGISALVSLTLTPMMCSRLLRSEREAEHGFLYRLSERGFSALVHGYDRGLRFVLRHRTLTLLVTLATVAFNVYLYVAIPKGLFPQQDNGTIMGMSEARQDVSYHAMYQVQKELVDLVRKDPDVDHVVAFIGGWSGTLNNGTMFVALKPMPPRETTADQIIGRLRPKVAQMPGVMMFLQASQDVRVGGRPSRTQYQYTLEDMDLEELRTWAPRVEAALRKLPQLKDVATDLQTAGLQMDLQIDRDAAAAVGLTPADVDNALYDSFGQRQVATTYTQVNQYRVVLESTPSTQRGPEGLDDIFVGTPSGAQVPIRSVTKRATSATPLSVNHQGQFPAITLSFNLAPGASLSQAVDEIHKAELAIGKPASVHASFKGTAQAFKESLSSQPMLIVTALFAVYVVLGVLYESYVHPVTILSTLPSAGVGAILALLAAKIELSVMAIIGILLLVGIVKKNAIMMVDFAIDAERTKGLAPIDAIREACLLRFRPILMTTLAALFGAVPLAIGHGMGAELRRPLGIAIIGGLVGSQLLTLFTTPVIYLALDRFTPEGRRRRRASSGEAPARPAEA